MKTLLHTEFATLLAHTDVRQAAFARLTGVTPRQVNNWCRGRAAVPKWAAILALVLAEFTPEALAIMLEEATSIGPKTPGDLATADVVPPESDDQAGPHVWMQVVPRS